MHLPDARLLLTGASGGIGQLLVERLCAGGARLLLVGATALRWKAWPAVTLGRSAWSRQTSPSAAGDSWCWRPRALGSTV